MILRGFLKDAGLFLRMPLILILIALCLSFSPVEGFIHPKVYRGGNRDVFLDQEQDNSINLSPLPTSVNLRENESESIKFGNDKGKANYDSNEIVISTKQLPSKPTRPLLPLHFGVFFNYVNTKPRTPVQRKRFLMFPEGGYPAGAGVGAGSSLSYYESNSKMYRHRYCFFNPVSCFRR